jgi:DNA helicase-2/ATP-dependent DNA helicase PcrA
MLEAARELVLTDEMKPKPRKSLTDVVEMFTRWQGMLENTPGHELAETILRNPATPRCGRTTVRRRADRLENLKELVETISGFESMRAFLEHVALVMDTDNNEISTPSRS